jgi:hypothetical protein
MDEIRNSICRRFFVGIVCGAALGSGGCATTASTRSENVKTSGLYADLDVTHELDHSVTVSASLHVGGRYGTSVTLSGADRWEVNGEAFPASDPESTVIAPTSDSTYNVTFVRSDEQVATTIVAPASPAILSLTPDQIRSTDKLTITWDATAPGTQLLINVTGDCLTTQQAYNTADDGALTTDMFSATPGLTVTCPIDVEIVRTTTFGVNSSFEGGLASGHRSATGSVEYIGIN